MFKRGRLGEGSQFKFKKNVANYKTSSVSQIKRRVALSSLVIGHSSRIGEISTEPTWPEHFSTLWCSTVHKTKYFLKAHDPLTTYPSSTQTLQTHPYLRKFIGCLAEGGGTEKCSSYFRWKSDQHPNSARSCDDAGNFYIWCHSWMMANLHALTEKVKVGCSNFSKQHGW